MWSSLNKPRILVVECDELVAIFVQLKLELFGCQTVGQAKTGEKAIQLAGELRPDLILMDVVMPGQNGFQLTRAINRTPEYAKIPIIICSSKNLETDRVWGMRQGARDYITKPVAPAELLSKIKALD